MPFSVTQGQLCNEDDVYATLFIPTPTKALSSFLPVFLVYFIPCWLLPPKQQLYLIAFLTMTIFIGGMDGREVCDLQVHLWGADDTTVILCRPS